MTGDPGEDESPCWAMFWRRDAAHRHEAVPVHASSRSPAEPRAGGLLGFCYQHVSFPKGCEDINKLSLKTLLQFSLASS